MTPHWCVVLSPAFLPTFFLVTFFSSFPSKPVHGPFRPASPERVGESASGPTPDPMP